MGRRFKRVAASSFFPQSGSRPSFSALWTTSPCLRGESYACLDSALDHLQVISGALPERSNPEQSGLRRPASQKFLKKGNSNETSDCVGDVSSELDARTWRGVCLPERPLRPDCCSEHCKGPVVLAGIVCCNGLLVRRGAASLRIEQWHQRKGKRFNPANVALPQDGNDYVRRSVHLCW